MVGSTRKRCRNDSGVLGAGSSAVLSRLTTLEASWAASSVSTRVPSTASGIQHCAFAVRNTSEAVRRGTASLNRLNPVPRSAANSGDRRWCNGFDFRYGCGGHELTASSTAAAIPWPPASGLRLPEGPGSAIPEPRDPAGLLIGRNGVRMVLHRLQTNSPVVVMTGRHLHRRHWCLVHHYVDVRGKTRTRRHYQAVRYLIRKHGLKRYLTDV